MARKDKYHHKLSSFNPAWCLVPPRTTTTTAAATATAHHKKSSHKQRRHSRPEVLSTELEPGSPVVGCMGQVRRSKRPSGATAAGSVRSDSSSSSSSSRSRSASPPDDPASTDRRNVLIRPGNVSKLKAFSAAALRRVETVEGMDPPLPVVERKKKEVGVQKPVSLWKRRCGGGGGDVLQLQLQLQPQMVQICRV
ncbi:putative nucleobase-ascorbate transporter 11 [Iris pallida]|uniref:Nucleobase-ascorbate transporter 11 n=1 Tax=Iris pallida TaxID=29817 RepID=A0AAX6EYJ3_IRIPA|nr:putative nucleobase-ascorbate transporter 11 [Iris pallida]